MSKLNKFSLYRTLFLSTLTLSAFTFGGGYVIVPLMKKKFVDQLGMLEEEEMLSMIVIAQSAPGPIAVNTAILLGYRLGGFLGALCTVFGAILPPLVTISILSYFYQSFKDNRMVGIFLKGLQIGASALILQVVYDMGRTVMKADRVFHASIAIAAFLGAFVLKLNVIYLILGAAAIGIVRFFLFGLAPKEQERTGGKKE